MAAGQEDVDSRCWRSHNTSRLSNALGSYRIECTCPGQSYKHLFPRKHTHTHKHAGRAAEPPSALVLSWRVKTEDKKQKKNKSINNNKRNNKTKAPVTFDVDVDVGSLLRALLQADVAAHVRRLSPGDVERGHAVHLPLTAHLGPLLPLPLHGLGAAALQLEGSAQRHHQVRAGRSDRGLGVACGGLERRGSAEVRVGFHLRCVSDDTQVRKTVFNTPDDKFVANIQMTCV